MVHRRNEGPPKRRIKVAEGPPLGERVGSEGHKIWGVARVPKGGGE